jgi:hypothetical protein
LLVQAGGGASGAGGQGASGGAGASTGGAGGAADGGHDGHAGNDGGSMAAFVASAVFGHVAATAPTTVTATPIVSRFGMPCQTLTQSIDIGGQTVHASALLCRQADGRWQLVPSQSALLGGTPPR